MPAWRSQILARGIAALLPLLVLSCGQSAETSAYQETVGEELSLTSVQLPSDCQRMVDLWQRYLDKFPGGKLADSARQKISRWNQKMAEEIERGFRVTIERADIKSVKGEGKEFAGRPWDILDGLPDAYVLLVIDAVTQGAPHVQDSVHPTWKFQSSVFRVSDTKRTSIVVQDRDTAGSGGLEMTQQAMGLGLLAATPGIAAVLNFLKLNTDDPICQWEGTLRDLVGNGGQSVTLHVGDCENLVVSVSRPR